MQPPAAARFSGCTLSVYRPLVNGLGNETDKTLGDLCFYREFFPLAVRKGRAHFFSIQRVRVNIQLFLNDNFSTFLNKFPYFSLYILDKLIQIRNWFVAQIFVVSYFRAVYLIDM